MTKHEETTPNSPTPSGCPMGRENVTWDLSDKMSYGGYLSLDKILSGQHPLSNEHDEMLFIIVHQVSELWMKLSLHELTAVLNCVRDDELGPAFKMLSRVKRVQNQLIGIWDTLGTLTPTDYARFRDSLGSSSGFQSYQFRKLEFLLGNKDAALVEVHRHDEVNYKMLTDALNSPALYDQCLRLLAKRGFEIPASRLDRDWSKVYVPDPTVEAAWLKVYRNTDEHWQLYELAEALVDIEERYQRWRFAHLKTVERTIGFKAGTGGTSGAAYLQSTLAARLFPELWTLRTAL